ncbi:hypothetical protein IGI37_000714 [Enterococcus sp. AZ194]
MKLKYDWTLSSDDEMKIKLFINSENCHEFVIRDQNDSGALCSFIISNTSFEIQELSWAIALTIDWKEKTIYLKGTDENKNE